MPIKSKASERVAQGWVIDTPAASEAVRQRTIRGATGTFTQDTTTKTSIGPLGFAGTLVRAFVSFATKPAGGTLSLQVFAYSASGDAEVALTDPIDPETLTDREAVELTLASTNVELQADDTLEVHLAASDDSVSAAGVGGFVTLIFEPSEPDIIDQEP